MPRPYASGSRVLMLSPTAAIPQVILEVLRSKGRNASKLEVVDPNSPEGLELLQGSLEQGTMGSCFKITCPSPVEDVHLDRGPERKLASQLSPKQAALPLHLRKRRP